MVKIPRAEQSVGLNMAMMPVSTADVGAPGKALQQLGKGIGALGEGLSGMFEEQNQFDDKLKTLNFINSEDRQRAEAQTNFTGDPNGFAASYDQGAAERAKQHYASLQSKWGRTVAPLQVEQHRGNQYESNYKFESSRILDQRIMTTRDTITGEFSKPEMGDPDKVIPAITTGLAASRAIISQIPGITPAQRDHLQREAGDLAMSKLQSTYRASGRDDMIYTDAVRMIEDWRKANPQASVDGRAQGPQPAANIRKVSDEHSIVTASTGANLRVSTTYADRFAGLVRDLEAAGIKINPDESGGYADRNIAGTNTKSKHAFGEAVDVNWSQNPRDGGMGQIVKQIPPEQIRAIAARNGLKWGGDWKNPDPMHFEVDRAKTYAAVPVSQRGITSYAGMPSGADGLTQHSPADVRAAFTPKVTAYSPQAQGSQMEGGYAASKAGPDGRAEVRTLEDLKEGKSSYFTLAGPPSEYGKSFVVPRIEWIDSKGNKQVSVNAVGVVHDTGGAFTNAPSNRFDIPVARDLTDKQMNTQPFLKGGVQFIPQGGTKTAALNGVSQPTIKGEPQGGRIFTSLQQPPNADEIQQSIAKGVKTFDFDVSQPGGADAAKAIKAAGGKVIAYHEGNGGGPAWGEKQIDLSKPENIGKLQSEVKALAAQGVDAIHLDNLHDLNSKQLETVVDAVKNASDGKVLPIAKNNAKAWAELIQRRPDLKPMYAVVENLIGNGDDKPSAKALADAGVPVHVVDFGKAKVGTSTRPVSQAQAQAFQITNPWVASTTHMVDEAQYEGRETKGAKVYTNPSREGLIPVADSGSPQGGTPGAPGTIPGKSKATGNVVRFERAGQSAPDVDQIGAAQRALSAFPAAKVGTDGSIDTSSLKPEDAAKVTDALKRSGITYTEQNGKLVISTDGPQKTAPNQPVRVAGPPQAPQGPLPSAGDMGAPFVEALIRHLPQMAAQHNAAQERWANNALGKIKEIKDLAEKGLPPDESTLAPLKAAIDMRPDLAAKYQIPEALASVQRVLQWNQQARQMPPEALQGYIAQLDAQQRQFGANKESEAQIEHAQKLLANTITQSNKDPNTWAHTVGLRPLSPINLDDPESLKKRAEDARWTANYLKQDVQFFTVPERDQLSDVMRKGGDGMLAVLGKVYQMAGADTGHAVKEFAKEAPEAAYIGGLMAVNDGRITALARDAAEGLRIRAEGKMKVPSIRDKTMETAAITRELGTAYKESRTTHDAIIKTAELIYDVRAMRMGKGDQFDQSMFNGIVKELTGMTKDEKGIEYGGLATHNGYLFGFGGRKVVAPANLRNDSFDAMLSQITDDDLKASGQVPMNKRGEPIGVKNVTGQTLVSAGKDRYYVQIGDPTDDAQSVYLSNPNGSRYVLDLGKLLPTLQARKPDLFRGGDKLVK